MSQAREDTPSGPSSTPPRGLRAGVRMGVGFGAAGFLLAVAFGATALSHAWSPAQIITFSMLTFSGSAQSAALTALTSGSGVVIAVAAAASITARFVPLGIAVGSTLHGGRLRKALEAQGIVDASWAAAHLGNGRFDRELMIGATIPQWLAWIAGTVVGVLVAPDPDLVETIGLDVAFPAFFLVLLFDEVRKAPRGPVVAVLAAGCAGGLLFVAPPGIALIVPLLVALIGLVPRKVEADPA
ncbi:MAG: branched-chain amino acid ABC transporter permease [Streptosporangiales bacterium]|nr:branched-chain amino acid ABC transporter permease [Streptosporangiales bacterium]